MTGYSLETRHLAKVDPVMRRLIREVGPFALVPPRSAVPVRIIGVQPMGARQNRETVSRRPLTSFLSKKEEIYGDHTA